MGDQGIDSVTADEPGADNNHDESCYPLTVDLRQSEVLPDSSLDSLACREFTAVELTVLSEVLGRAPAWFLMPSADDVVITTPGGRPLDTAALFRHATAHAPTLTGYVLGRLLFDIEQNQSQLAKFAEAVRSLRDALTNNEGDVEG